MATYFAHSINQVDKDGKDAGDCLTCVLANPSDKDAILQALRDNLMLMNQMREDRITAEKATAVDKIAAAQAKLTVAEAERDALGTKLEAEAIIKQKKIDAATAKKQEAEAELAELTKVEIAIDAEEEVNVKA